jgi:hypothetical protein
MREEDTTEAEAAPPSVVNSLAPTISVVDTDDAPDRVQDDSNDSRNLDRM